MMTAIGCRIPTAGTLHHGLCQMGQAAERAGVASLWVGDHVVMFRGTESRYPYSPDGVPPGLVPETPFYEALSALAWLAACTSRVGLGTAVLVLPQRDPVLVAKQAASIDALSGGRVVLGVGAGWLAEEMQALGWDFASRGRRLDEAIAVLRSCWSGAPTAFRGEFFSLPEGVTCYPTPDQTNGIPVLVGGMSKAAVRRAAMIGDGWLALARVDSLDLANLNRLLRRAQARTPLERPPLRTVVRLVGDVSAREHVSVLKKLGQLGFEEIIIEVPWTSLDRAEMLLAAAVEECTSIHPRTA